MAEYKNQHFVPQYLLRGWAENEKVPIYNLKNQEEYRKTSISNLCSEDYFYGDAEVEKGLDDLEGLHSDIIGKLRSTKSFKSLDYTEKLHFCVFILFQRNRTKQTKVETEKVADNLAKEVLKMEVKSGQIDPDLPSGGNILDHLDEFKITPESPLAYPMLYALTGVDLIVDLDIAIIVNESDLGFVLSDHPVVHDNRRFKDKVDKYLAGIQSRGLQMFVPISDEVQILLYDPKSYFVNYSNKEKRQVFISSERVVKGLNKLQMVNAFQNVFYRERNREAEMVEAQQNVSEYIEEESTVFQVSSPEEHNFESENDIIESGQTLSDYSPYLPFVKQRVETEFDVARRPEILQAHREHVDEIVENAEGQLENEKEN